LSDPFDVLTIDFQRLSSLSQTAKVDVRSTAQGTCHAVIFWFELFLGSETLFNSKQEAVSNHWKQAIQFFDSDYPTTESDIFHLGVEQDRAGLMFRVL